eukprot:1937677-Rhodomonas_salina.5
MTLILRYTVLPDASTRDTHRTSQTVCQLYGTPCQDTQKCGPPHSLAVHGALTGALQNLLVCTPYVTAGHSAASW